MSCAAQAQVDVPTVFKPCSNCKQPILAGNLATHEAHCFRRMALCPHCGELMQTTEIEAHVRERVADLPTLLDALDAGELPRIRAALAHGGATVAGWRDAQGQSLLQLVAQRAGKGTALAQSGLVTTLLRELVSTGSLPSQSDSLGLTPLHAAAKAGAAVAVGVLLEAGADACAQSRMGSTPLGVANGEDVRLLLLQAGAAVRGPPVQLPRPAPPTTPRDPARGSRRDDAAPERRLERGVEVVTPAVAALRVSEAQLVGDDAAIDRPRSAARRGLPHQPGGGGKGCEAREGSRAPLGAEGHVHEQEQRRHAEDPLLAPPPPLGSAPFRRPSSSRHVQRLRSTIKSGQ